MLFFYPDYHEMFKIKQLTLLIGSAEVSNFETDKSFKLELRKPFLPQCEDQNNH